MASKRFSKDYLRYEKLCEEDVLALTEIEFDTWDREGSPPSLDFHFREGNGWTFERIVQMLHIHRQIEGKHNSLLLLIELYREEPVAILHQQIVTALKIGKPLPFRWSEHGGQVSRLLNDIPTYLDPAKKLPLFRHFLEGFFPFEKGMEATLRRLALETANLILSRVDESEAFKIYVEREKKYGIDDPDMVFQPPILIGLHSILSKQLDKFRENSMEHIVTWRQRRHNKQLSGSVSRWNSRTLYDRKPFQFAFAPSGSGKTASIFDELTHRYGHYMVSCALAEQKVSEIGGSIDPSLGDLRQTFMDPKLPEGVSKDTHEIIRMFKIIKPLFMAPEGHGQSDMVRTCIHWWKYIFLTRSEIFRWFRKALASDSTPFLWLSFQLDCSEWDPFLQTFRVLSLFEERSELAFLQSQPSAKIFKEVDWACIDEAQEDLRFTIEQKNLLAACMNAMSIWSFDRNNFGYFRQVIFAGTSLNVSEALKTRKEIVEDLNRWNANRGKVWHQSAHNITHRFPLVLNRDDTAAVLKAFGIENAPRAVDQSEPLWGRVKWTAMYAEKIIEAIKEGETEDYHTMPNDDFLNWVKETFAKKQEDLNFRALAEKTVIEITDNLYAKLNALQERGDCGELLDQLLEAAISADILSRPHVFYQKSDLQLVEQGFAIVNSWMDDLESKLNGRFIFDGRIEGQLIARLKEDQSVEELNKLTDEMLRDGFTVVDCSIAKLATELEEKGLTIIDRSRTHLTAKPFEATAMTSEQIEKQIGDLAERITRKKDSFTVERYMKDKLTADMVKHGFTVWGCGDGDRKKLRKSLMAKGIRIEKETVNQLSARQEEPPYMDDSKADQLGDDITKKGFVMLDKTMDQLLDASGDGFVIRCGLMSTEPRIYFRSRGLREQDFEIESETELRMRVKLKKDHDTRDIKSDRVAASLKSCGLKIVNKTKDQLDKLVRGPFTVVNRSKDELTAKLAERVVIDTIIRFSISNRRLDEKLMRYVKLAASRHGLGHFAENLLAVRLRQYLSQPTNPNRVPLKDANGAYENKFKNEWALKKGQVLTCLAKAKNFDAKQVDPLDDYALVTGAQTVKKFELWEDWERSFRDWLNAIGSRRKPCASFLIPHDYFGPDLVFALRKETEDENTVVLCSIQLKLGEGSSDAVNKSSITWACGERKGGTKEGKTRAPEAAEEVQNLENMKNEVKAREAALREMTYDDDEKNLYTEVLRLVDGRLEEINDEHKNLQENTELKHPSKVKTLLESPFWRDQSKLSLLIATGAKEGSGLGRVRPYTPYCNQSREYYAFIEGTDTKSLFGATFETILGVVPD